MKHINPQLNKLCKAPISEIFYSFQGEGIFLGQPQIFIRFAGCNLKCDYCDTPGTQKIKKNEKYYSIPDVLQQINKYLKKNSSGNPVPETVSITGGEPLIHAEFLSYLLPEINKLNLSVYLETNGTLPDAYNKIKKYIKTVSMDIKPESGCGKNFWKEHEKFIKLAMKSIFIKLVLTDKTDSNEIFKAIKLIKSISPAIPFVLQPATSTKNTHSIKPWQIYEWSLEAGKTLSKVYVIPQMHKIWKVR